MKAITPKTRATSRRAASGSVDAKRGNMKLKEIKPLVMAARKAFNRQSEAGLVDDGETFDAWRHRQCQAAVGKPGITACKHGDFQPLLAHFQTLAGDDAAAFRSQMKTGKPTDHAAPGDTHEVRRQIVNEIANHLEQHTWLAETSLEMIIAEGEAEWDRQNPGVPYPGPNPDWFKKIRDRKLAIEAREKGPITVGYIVYLVRAKTRRPDLTLGRDWKAGLAERCTVTQLDQILYSLVNRIAAVEGTGHTRDRNKSQRRRVGESN